MYTYKDDEAVTSKLHQKVNIHTSIFKLRHCNQFIDILYRQTQFYTDRAQLCRFQSLRKHERANMTSIVRIHVDGKFFLLLFFFAKNDQIVRRTEVTHACRRHDHHIRFHVNQRDATGKDEC